MSEQSPEYDERDDQNDSSVIRTLRREAEEGRKAKAEAEELRKQNEQILADQQELAMRRAGIDPETPLARMFAKANPGLTDVDSIKNSWGEISGANQSGAVPMDQQQAYQQMNAAVSGGVPTGGAVPDFNGQLDAIPLVVDGQYNPDYQNQVLAVARNAAAAQGRPFEVSGGQVTWQEGAPGPGPVTSETA